MLKVNEAIKSNYLLFDANGNPATGKTVTASVYDETDTFYSSPAVSEIASTGIYQASFTPDTLGEWTIIFDCTDPNATDAMTYFIGMGQEPDILTEVAGLNGDAMRGTDSAALAATALSNVTWADAKAGFLTGDAYVRLGAPVGASISVDIAANLTAINALNNITAANVWETNISAYSGAGYGGTYLKTLYDDWLNGGRLDLLLDACSTHSAADVMNVNISAYSTAGYAGTYIKTLYDDWLNGGRLDLLIDSIITYVDCLPASMGDIVTKDLADVLSDSTAFAGADIAAIKGLVDSAEAAGPYSYTDAGGEQTVKEDTLTTRRHIHVEVSNRNMTQTGTFRIYRKVDGSNYDLYTSQAVKVAAGSDRAWDAEFTTNQAWKVTYEENSDEGAARNIPYNVITQVIE